jgi:hypothetical protein
VTAGQEEPAQQESAQSSALDRRSFVRTATVGGATAAALAAAGGLASPAFAASGHSRHSGQAGHSGQAAQAIQTDSSGPTLRDAGAGMHVGIGSVQMIACATISRTLTTCQVGQIGLTFSQLGALATFLEPILGILLGAGWSGPFAMEMYSKDVKTFEIDRPAGKMTAKGMVRSITKIAGVTIEDVTTPYLAVATDGRGSQDSYFLSFTSPFWATPGNPLATPSTFHPGWSMFGGELIVGEVSVPRS